MANALKKQTEGDQLPDFIKTQAQEYVGKGSSTDQADNLIPLMYVLQGLSPQVNKRNDAYIEGASPGDIWLRNAPKEIVSGTEGIIFQPCAFNKNWVEWVPRDDGGGRRGIFPFDALVEKEDGTYYLKSEGKEIPVAATYKDGNPNIPHFKLPNGNDLIETRYHTGFAVVGEKALPYVISFKSTGHTVSKEWMGKILQHSEVDGKNPDPAWLHTYRLTTRMRKNKDGEWFVLQIADAGRISTEDEWKRGLALHNAVMAGEKQVGEEINEGGASRESAPF